MMGTMVSMELTDEEKYDTAQPIAMPSKPDYSYGLCICLTQDELDKLGLDASEVSVGDTFHFEAMARVTSISANDGPNGPTCRIESQIEEMGVLEPSDPKPAKARLSSIYKT